MGGNQSKISNKNKYVAVFDCEKSKREELSFSKNDELLKINDIDEQYFNAKNLRTECTGIVNKNMVLNVNNYQLQPWYFGLYTRTAAEMQLMSESNESGCFLIRESDTTETHYTLSILYDESNSRYVKHYKIHFSNKRYFLNPKHKFKSLTDLVDYYLRHKKDDQSYLGKPCNKIIKLPIDFFNMTIDDVIFNEKFENFDAKSSELLKGKKNFPNTKCSCIDFEALSTFGFVYLGKLKRQAGRLKNDRTSVLIKFSKYYNSKKLLNEIEILKKIENKNIIKLIGASIGFPFVFACMEDMCLNDLETHIQFNKLNKQIIVRIAKQICHAMSYLIDNYIIHRNLRTKNILIDQNYFVKLSNFGDSRRLDLNRQLIVEYVSEDLSIKWVAYEIIKCCEKTGYKIYSEKSEIWAFGVLLYELFSRKEPYEGIEDKTLIKMITEEDYRMPDPQPYFEETTTIFYENVIRKCWSKCYVIRPTFKELIDLFSNYFDFYESDYVFSHSTKKLEQSSDIISTDLVNFGILIQSGHFSEIWKSTLETNNEIVIVKKFKKNVSRQKSLDININKFLHESKILKKLNHQNIIKMLAFSSWNEYYIILEYMQNGSLDIFLRKEDLNLRFPQLLNFAEQISNGMMYLECSNIVHGDLAARNVLVGKLDKMTGKYPIKVSDFELAHELIEKNQIISPLKKKIEFAVRWAAPEVVVGIDNYRIISSKSDVYSFGLVMYEIITKGELPFKDIQQEDLIEKVFFSNYVIQRSEVSCPEDYYNIMRSCLNFDQDKRPHFSTLYEWFLNYFSDKKLTKKISNNLSKMDPIKKTLSNQYNLVEVTRL